MQVSDIKQKLVSVVIPIYNSASTLMRCLDSLKGQTFADFEAILVDDGSTDESGRICDDYSAGDTRFHVIHKANGGVSSARQCGLDNACGEYVIHADPDDWVEPGMLESLLQIARFDNADMVICDYFEDDEGLSKHVKQRPSSLDHETILYELFQQLHGSCCNKLVKRACYSKYGIKFPLQLSFCEDTYVNVLLLQEDIKLTYLPDAFYHYCISPNSLSRQGVDAIHERQIVLLEALSSSLRSEYKLKSLSVLENDIAIGTLTLKQLTDFDLKALQDFKSAFPNLYRRYWQISCPFRRRLYYFLAFHGMEKMLRRFLVKRF